MNNTNVKWEQRQEPPSFRQWLEIVPPHADCHASGIECRCNYKTF